MHNMHGAHLNELVFTFPDHLVKSFWLDFDGWWVIGNSFSVKKCKHLSNFSAVTRTLFKLLNKPSNNKCSRP
jgi:hypothetical protein